VAIRYNGSNQFHNLGGIVPDIAVNTLTVSFWIRPRSLASGDQSTLFATQGTNPDFGNSEGVYFMVRTAASNLPACAVSAGGTTTGWMTGASALSADVWQHVVIWRSGTVARCYVDGVQIGSDGTCGAAAIDVNIIRVAMGRNSIFDFGPYNGVVCEVAVWESALGDADRAALDAGLSPRLVQPASLRAYYPMIRDVIDIIERGGVTAFNAPTAIDHPRMVYSAGPINPSGIAAGENVLSVSFATEVSVGQTYTPATPVGYSTTVEVVQSFANVSNEVKYTTEIDATAFIGGDFDVSPEPGVEVTYTTEVSVEQRSVASLPVLLSLSTEVVVSQSATMSDLVTFRTEILVKQRHASAIDGRVDLLGTNRYRR
jgi:hypothetical protein